MVRGRQKDPTNHGSWTLMCLGPWNQNVGSSWLWRIVVVLQGAPLHFHMSHSVCRGWACKACLLRVMIDMSVDAAVARNVHHGRRLIYKFGCLCSARFGL